MALGRSCRGQRATCWNEGTAWAGGRGGPWGLGSGWAAGLPEAAEAGRAPVGSQSLGLSRGTFPGPDPTLSSVQVLPRLVLPKPKPLIRPVVCRLFR